jgi:opacity protein-like surface antigen
MRPITMMFLVAVLLVPATARAAGQAPSAEVSVEYAYLRDPDLKNMPKGWAASAALHLSDTFAVVGDVGANYKTESLVDLGGVGTAKETITSFQGGLRLTARGDSGSAWIQALAGGTRASIRFEGDNSSDSETHFSIQPGIGFDFRLTDSLALRAGGDYRRVFLDGGGVNEYRAHGGIVFFFGTR